MNTAAAAGAAARAIMAALCDSGVEVVCLSPGSRSTPLVLAAADHPGLDVRVIGDERSAGYYAIGLAKSQGVPVAVVCTSGTAAANLLPAAAEAMRACVPIVLITADRPPEMRDFGSAQTIDQMAALSGHVRWQAELLVPSGDVEVLLRHYRTAASRAVASATIPPGGPVHLNAPFREPFFDPGRQAAFDGSVARSESIGILETSAAPKGNTEGTAAGAGAGWARVWAGRCVLDDADTAALAETLTRCGRGLLIAGPDAAMTRADARAIERLASVLGWPLLADPVSGVRFTGGGGDAASSGILIDGTSPHELRGMHGDDDVSSGVLIDAYDGVLRSPRFRARTETADVIVRVGGLPVSKVLLTTIEQSRARQIVLAPPGLWPDPFLVASDVVWADPAEACRNLASRVEATDRSGVDDAWLGLWQRAAAAARRQIDRAVESSDELFDGRVARALCERLGEDWLLWVGNSMPVRDLDTFVSRTGCRARVLANRGASGIDGTLSAALGAAGARRGRIALLTGDLAFLHDVGGLQIAARQELDLLIAIVNNDGGGIFSFLPQAELGETFERYFVTPHGLDLAKATEMARGRHRRADTPEQLDEALDAARGETGLRVVEALVSRDTNRRIRDAIVESAAAAVDDVVAEQPS